MTSYRFRPTDAAGWLAAGAATLLLIAGFANLTRPAFAQGVDINVIFNCEPDGPLGAQDVEQCAASRTLLLGTCTACHTFVPIVKAQKSETQWNATLQVHRTRTRCQRQRFRAAAPIPDRSFQRDQPVTDTAARAGSTRYRLAILR